ncbi:hypothetical protein PR003_g9245 [Phytophthora rubi]|uniref:SCP domain-containing protein n=1 Tax=Phytophthora rubi TaxID=129364 RepID=A0A6A3MZN2_9STRA|nr:hypothetical protein PR002_g8662 [Phytophthora rubi]KAE9036710.1 hypothetical protein PR001_g8702 [Phytophthora rubi]KAE9342889.1 hypothetical protein PR003_g9245 [Phytophthora rubi]
MSSLQSLRAIIVLVSIATALSASSVAASYEVANDGGSAANSTADSAPRYLMGAAGSDYHTALLNAVNTERAARGLSKLCRSRKLQSAAQTHSNDMAKRNYLGHTGSDGSTVESRIDDAGYHWIDVAENVAAGQASVKSVMSSWMSSSHHRANILSRKYKMFGCGYAYRSSSKYDHYWTQDFASGSGEVCS